MIFPRVIITTPTITSATPYRVCWNPSTITNFNLNNGPITYTKLSYRQKGAMGAAVELDQPFNYINIFNSGNQTFYGSFLIDPNPEQFLPGAGVLGAFAIPGNSEVSFNLIDEFVLRITLPGGGSGTLQIVFEKV